MNISRILLIAGHVILWAGNYWLVAFGSDFNWNGFSASDYSLTYAYSYGLFFNALLFYMQVFWLYPKMYHYKKKKQFYLLNIAFLLLITTIEAFCDNFLYEIYNIPKPYLCDFISSLMVHTVYVVAGFYYALKLAFRKSEKLRQKLVEETYKIELKYLKAQLNPHFLFNGINNVYHLIGKNNELAKETLHQFSDLLRYQLYESNTHILLEKELDYISKYIKIEETNRGSDIRLEYDISAENPSLKIAPLLLIPFIENAFKHCSNYMDGSANIIKIKIEEIGRKLHLKISNTYDQLFTKDTVGGIGLNNVQKRLSLLYTDSHELHIDKDRTHYHVYLSINLKS